jgi:hypothetical protein
MYVVQVRTQNFSLARGGGEVGEGANSESIYNLCLILKITL